MSLSDDDLEIAREVRRLAGLPDSTVPDDSSLVRGVLGFVDAFDYWYIRVMRAAVLDYRNLIIKRINPFIRRVEFDGLSSTEAAQRLVDDYAQRNFVTAGGWALEELAIASSPTLQKSTAEGIDAQRQDPTTSDYHLYVLKSGLVTRNSDIINALKSHGRSAERLLRQGRGTTNVHLNYVILQGKTASSFADGVNRPASAEFWAEALGVPQDEAIEFALAMAAEAGRRVTSDASTHKQAMVVLVDQYIRRDADSLEMDWDFIAKRNLKEKSTWDAEDRARHKRALAALKSDGYQPAPTDPDATELAEAVAGSDVIAESSPDLPTQSADEPD